MTPEKTITSDDRRNVALDLLLTILMCGLWNIYVQYRQMLTLNTLLKQEEFSYWKMGLLTLVTCGLYFIYYEYQKARALHTLIGKEDESDIILAVVLSFLGLNFVWDAIFQTKLNAYLDQQANAQSITSAKS